VKDSEQNVKFVIDPIQYLDGKQEQKEDLKELLFVKLVQKPKMLVKLVF
jgi:hypothetical protein